MTQPSSGHQSGSGEQWNVNLPAVIGVVFVFLVGVIVWVVVSSGGDESSDDSSNASALTTAPAAITDGANASTTSIGVGTTSPAPMPEPTDTTTPPTSDVATTDLPTSSVAVAPVTTAPGSESGAVPGDLAVPGRPMQRPNCENSFITVIASAVGDNASAGGIGQLLETYAGSNYLRTDQTCSSLTPDIDGEPIYVVYLGPFAVASDACAARAQGPEGSYARRLTTEVGPDHAVSCS